MKNLWVPHDLADLENGGIELAVFVENPLNPLPRVLGGPILDDVMQLLHVGPPLSGGGILGVLAQVRAADGLGEGRPIGRRGVPKLTEAVFRLEGVVGIIRQVPVADVLRLLPQYRHLCKSML